MRVFLRLPFKKSRKITNWKIGKFTLKRYIQWTATLNFRRKRGATRTLSKLLNTPLTKCMQNSCYKMHTEAVIEAVRCNYLRWTLGLLYGFIHYTWDIQAIFGQTNAAYKCRFGIILAQNDVCIVVRIPATAAAAAATADVGVMTMTYDRDNR